MNTYEYNEIIRKNLYNFDKYPIMNILIDNEVKK